MSEIDLGSVQYDKGGLLSPDEMNKLDGTRVKIASVNLIKDTSRYKDGVLLPNEEEIEVYKIAIETEPFGESTIGRNVVHKEKYNLKAKNGTWVISLHEKSKTAQFLSKYGIDKFENSVGKEVVLTKKTNPESKRSWLAISI